MYMYCVSWHITTYTKEVLLAVLPLAKIVYMQKVHPSCRCSFCPSLFDYVLQLQ